MQPHWVLCLLLFAGPDWNELTNAALREEHLGRYKEAEKLLRDALAAAMREQTNHRPAAVTLNNLGGVLLSQGKYLEAETALKRSLAYFQEEQSGSTEWTAALNHLAMLYRETGRLRESEDAYRRVLAARTAALGAGNVQVARSHANLAAILIDRGVFREAQQHLEVALDAFEKSPGGQPDRATILVNLSVLHARQGDRNAAASRAVQGVAVLEAYLEAGHPAIGRALLTLGSIQLELGQTHVAEEDLRRSVQILKAAFPGGHPVLAEAVLLYAGALEKGGRKREAKLAKREAASMQAVWRAQNPDHLSVSVTELQTKTNR